MSADPSTPTRVSEFPSAEETAAGPSSGGSAAGVQAVVLIGDLYSATVLRGDTVIGRSRDCGIRIDHPSVSRRHARITLGSPPTVEDLGSSNGTRKGELQLKKGRPVELALGELVKLGEAMLFLQPTSAPVDDDPLPRRLWVHGYFEARLESECARAVRLETDFAVMRISADPKADGRVEEILFGAFRDADVVGYYGPGEFEVLLVDTNPADTMVAHRRIQRTLAGSGISAGVGLAIYPDHGQSADALLAHASAQTRKPPPPTADAPRLIFSGAEMTRIVELAERISQGDITVLLHGETGVGKEVVAEALHQRSPRRDQPLLKLNCAALSETLLESELFGHERGAFTGAAQAKTGLLEAATGGTVFLDEVGELPLHVQAKLLRVIEAKEVRPVGGVTPRRIDVRFIAATNRDLSIEVSRGAFRADLYFRLSGASIVVPPLRKRLDQIEELATEFIAHAARQGGFAPPTLSASTLEHLKSYSWPGNIRELRNVIERAVLLCDGVVLPEHLPLEKMSATRQMRGCHRTATAELDDDQQTITGKIPVASEPPLDGGLGESMRVELGESLRAELRDVERRYIEAALERAGGNQREAASLLQISRRTLINRLDALGIERPRKRR